MLPAPSLLNLLLHCYPMVSIGQVLAERSLRDGPLFVKDAIQNLISNVTQYPAEFHYFCAELFKRCLYIYL